MVWSGLNELDVVCLEPDPREEDVQQDKGDEEEDAGHPDQVLLCHDTFLRQTKHLDVNYADRSIRIY